MRRYLFTIFNLVLATAIAITVCEAEGLSNEGKLTDSTQTKGTFVGINDE